MKSINRNLIFILFTILQISMKVNALIPVSYACCENYTLSDGVQLDNFEKKEFYGVQLDNFEKLTNWTIGGVGTEESDITNFYEGSQGLKLTAIGDGVYTTKFISDNFSTTNNFAFWMYVYNIASLDHITILFTSTLSGTPSKYFSKSIYVPNIKTGWNKVIFSKNDFVSTNSESWNNIMNRVRIYAWPVSGQNTNVTFDDLKYDVVYDWIGNSQEADIFNFKEGQQGLKLIATNETSAYSDLTINENFSASNNFVVWAYIDNPSKLRYMYIYFTSTGSNWNKYFYDAINGNSVPAISGVKAGWNKLIFNKNNFKNNGGESWNNVMNRIRLRVYSGTGLTANVTFDDLRYDMIGKRAKLMIEFDDGYLSTYTKAYPILNSNNQHGVSYVMTAYPEKGNAYGYMNLNNLRILQNANWDISSHTVHHYDLTTLNDTTLTSELNDSYAWLVNNKFQKSAGFIAYPYGSFNDHVIDEVGKRYIFGRSVVPEAAQQHYTSTDYIRYIQRTINIYNSTTVQSVKDQINNTVNEKLLGILVFHDIVDSDPGTYDYLTTDLQAISDFIKNIADVDVVTYTDYMIPNINNFTPVINKTTRIYANGSSVLITENKYDEYMPNMTVEPSSDSIDMNLTMYSDELIKFNESSFNNSIKVSYNIGDRIPNSMYQIAIYWSNGTKYQDFNVLANNSGYISYNSEGFDNYRYQQIKSQGLLDTSFTVTMPIGYTFLRFNASNSSIKNVDPDGQNNSMPIFNITNIGNINQSFKFYLNGTVINIITYADLDNDHSAGRIEVNMIPSIIIPNLNPGSSQSVWMVMDAKNAPEINTNKSLIINNSMIQ